MFDNVVEETDYIKDCSKYQLAVKLGLFGILLSLIATIAWEVFWFIYYEMGDIHIVSIAQAAVILNPIAFTGSLFTSVGFVGVFAMKRSRLGIIFPLLIFTSQYLF